MHTAAVEGDERRTWNAGRTIRLALLQAKVELVNRYTRPSALSFLFTPILIFVLLRVAGTDWLSGDANARRIIGGLFAASTFVGGLLSIAMEMITEQDDGSILRAKTLPFGLASYLLGKIFSLSVTSALGGLTMLIAARLALTGVFPGSPARWIALIGVVLLTLGTAAPLGALIGSLVKSPMVVLPLSIGAYGIMVVSGVFFPLSVYPAAIAAVVKIFPVYWLGLLSRTIIAPGQEDVGAVQLTLAVLVPLIWAGVGLLLAPKWVSALSRRQSGSRLESIQRRRAARGY